LTEGEAKSKGRKAGNSGSVGFRNPKSSWTIQSLQQTKSNKVLFEKFIDFARLVGVSLRFLLALLEACYLLIGKSLKIFSLDGIFNFCCCFFTLIAIVSKDFGSSLKSKGSKSKVKENHLYLSIDQLNFPA
jgi:hypothetical protein